MYSKAGQHDFNSNSADFHHFSRVPQHCVLQTGNITQWCRPKISQTSIFPFLQKNVINCSFNDKYRVWMKFSLHLKLIYNFLQLCEMFLSVVDWLVIPPHSSLLPPLSSPPRTVVLFQTGMIVDARLKELTPTMPVIFIRAIPVDKQENRNVYQCPVYKTRQRGPTYVWTFNLKTKENPSKWTLAGVALLLQI